MQRLKDVSYTMAEFVAKTNQTYYAEKGPDFQSDFTTLASDKNFAQADAQKLIELLGDKKQATIVEAGPGTGLLAREFLNQLKKQKPRLYEKTTYAIIDVSKKDLSAIGKHLSKHAKHLRLIHASATRLPLKNDYVDLYRSNELLDDLGKELVHRDKKGLKKTLVLGVENGKIVPKEKIRPLETKLVKLEILVSPQKNPVTCFLAKDLKTGERALIDTQAAKVLREAHRVLKKNATMIQYDYYHVGKTPPLFYAYGDKTKVLTSPIHANPLVKYAEKIGLRVKKFINQGEYLKKHAKTPVVVTKQLYKNASWLQKFRIQDIREKGNELYTPSSLVPKGLKKSLKPKPLWQMIKEYPDFSKKPKNKQLVFNALELQKK